jgi:hypothetical protein
MATGPRRRRRAFSLNGLAIQVSAFALSFMLVALLVVGSSKAAFVEENETVTERVPVGLPTTDPAPWTPYRDEPSAASPTSSSPATTPTSPAELPPEAVAQLLLTDDSAGTAMFADEQGLVPGVPEERCIRVTLSGDVPADRVVLYAAEVRGALAQYLEVTVEEGGGGGVFGDCSAFIPSVVLFQGDLAGLAAGHGSYESGLVAWRPAASGESRSFRFTVVVRDVPEAEALTAGFGLTWETRA